MYYNYIYDYSVVPTLSARKFMFKMKLNIGTKSLYQTLYVFHNDYNDIAYRITTLYLALISMSGEVASNE